MNRKIALDIHMDLKWKIRGVAVDDSLSIGQKYRLIKDLLDGMTSTGPIDRQRIGVKEKIYAFIFRNKMTATVLGLELALANGGKRCIPTRLFNLLRYWLKPLKGIAPIRRGGKTAFIFMVPDLGNLGDLAIGVAQKTFLEAKLTGYAIVEIPQELTYEAARSVKKQATSEDIILLTGGGNLGTLYQDAELQRRFLVQKFRKNRIIQFPQSMFFENTRAGDRFLQQSIALYSKHAHLTLIARDKPTFELMKGAFHRNRVELLPDTVLHLSPIAGTTPRERLITVSMRRDKESNLAADQISEIEQVARELGMELLPYDTNIDNLRHRLDERMTPLNDIWDTYKRSKLVITDRLHGVIFCAITGTPCVAINNSNGKVGNLIATWLAEANYIHSLEGLSRSTLRAALLSLTDSYPNGATPIELRQKFHHMLSVIEDR